MPGTLSPVPWFQFLDANGAPYGGACLPKDTRGFLGLAERIGVPMPLLSAAPGLYPIAAAHLMRGLDLAEQARVANGDVRAALLSELDEGTRSGRRAHPTRMPRAAVEPSVGRRPAGLPQRPSGVRHGQRRPTERAFLKIPPLAGDASSSADGD